MIPISTVYYITSFGASDTCSAKDNQTAIQAAIDTAHDAGGGTVLIPPGRYVTANLKLRSHVRLYMSPGSSLIGSDHYLDYEFSSTPYPSVEMMGLPFAAENVNWCALIYAEEEEDIEICGTGTIDGQGMDHRYFPNPDDPYLRRPLLLYFEKCHNIRVSDVTLKNPAVYAFLGSRSNRLFLHNVQVFSMQTENGDGLDFNGCSDVIIQGCSISSGDDAISLKTTYPDAPCRNIVISNCILRAVWSGFRMGTESSGDMRDILLSDCIFDGCSDGIKIQDCSTGVYENIRIRNISMRNVHRPVFMSASSFRLSKSDASIRPAIGGIQCVDIDGLTAYMSETGSDYQRNCFVISGCPSSLIRQVSLRNIYVHFQGKPEAGSIDRVDTPEFLDYTFLYADIFSINGGYPAAGIFLRHIEDLTLENCRLLRTDDDLRPMFWGYNLQSITLNNVHASGCSKFFIAEDSDISLLRCSFNHVPVSAPDPLSPDLKQRYLDFKHCTEKTDHLFDYMAQQVDHALSCPIQHRYDMSVWNQGSCCWTTILPLPENAEWLMLVSYGDVDIRLNGVHTATCHLPHPYRNLFAWAIPLTDIRGDQLHIELQWQNPSDHGGTVCKLPFGNFTGFNPGLYGTTRICVKEKTK